MARYKVLPLPHFFEANFDFICDGDLKLAIKRLKKDGYKQIEPIFNRDGWYYDRETRNVWYEWHGSGWYKLERKYGNDKCVLEREDSEQFLFELTCLDHRILESDEVSAINMLIVYGSCPKELIQLLYWHKHLVDLRDTYRNARINILKTLKESE